jgi:hypothetical protein
VGETSLYHDQSFYTFICLYFFPIGIWQSNLGFIHTIGIKVQLGHRVTLPYSLYVHLVGPHEVFLLFLEIFSVGSVIPSF